MEGCGFLYLFPALALLIAWMPWAAAKYRWHVNNPKFLGDGNRDGPVRDLVLLFLDAMMASVCVLFAFISWQLPRISTDGGSLGAPRCRRTRTPRHSEWPRPRTEPWWVVPAWLGFILLLLVAYCVYGAKVAESENTRKGLR